MIDDEEGKKNIAKNLSKILEERGMSQRALATATGDSPMRISHYVLGKTQPVATALSRIAEALGVSMESLVYGEQKTKRKNCKTRLAST